MKTDPKTLIQCVFILWLIVFISGLLFIGAKDERTKKGNDYNTMLQLCREAGNSEYFCVRDLGNW